MLVLALCLVYLFVLLRRQYAWCLNHYKKTALSQFSEFPHLILYKEQLSYVSEYRYLHVWYIINILHDDCNI